MIEEFEIALSIAESGLIDNIINEALGRPEFFSFLAASNNLKSSLTNELDIWKEQVKVLLSTESTETKFHDEITYYQEVKSYSDEYFLKNMDTIIDGIDINSVFYSQASDLIGEQKIEKNPLFKIYFCEQWHQALFNCLQEEKFNKLDRKELLQDLYQRADTMKQLNEIEDDIDEQKNMRLWDMANAKLSKRDVSYLKKITLFLQKNNELQKIAEKLGRMANKVVASHSSHIKSEQTKKIEVDNNHAAGNIIGIHDSNDLERLLPIEGMFLTSPELETIFYKRLAEKRLSTYQLQSTQPKNKKITHFEKTSAQADIDKGPFVIAIDASGSMMGAPEQYAKAFAYGLMQIALAEDRDCYIIIFSTQQITYELTKDKGLSELLSFLSYSFNGGTDLTPVLEKSVDLMSTEKYFNADLIVISDFIAPKQPESVLNKIEQIKKQKNRFHALNLSKYGNPELLAIFDHYWEYHPSTLSKLMQLFKDNK